ncbi:LPS O-antigen subunit length determinant protein (WzzB/FepE family) [Rhizobium fabae]|uniref:LPS O-antigen subunit length determinant protein (WzzB/FepE family) n=1 Tax=Rhizobium fabae TaxID=573179 RepID=A0A7W6B841_9HYPH|nr:LPS O-antigen subunit length determinant protein (WzzB/FepE family) [Rhizobium fabae]
MKDLIMITALAIIIIGLVAAFLLKDLYLA